MSARVIRKRIPPRVAERIEAIRQLQQKVASRSSARMLPSIASTRACGRVRGSSAVEMPAQRRQHRIRAVDPAVRNTQTSLSSSATASQVCDPHKAVEPIMSPACESR